MLAEYGDGELIGGRYLVDRIVGEGGYGLVLRVRDTNENSEFAIKTFKNELALDEQEKQQFRNEVLTWINLGGHESIIRAHRVHDFNGRLFVVMDYISPDDQGRVTLQDYMAHPSDISESLIYSWMG